MKNHYRLLTSFFLSFSALNAEIPEGHSVIANEQTRAWKYKMRVKAIKKLDHFLNWSLSDRLKKFDLMDPHEKEFLEIDIPELGSFAKQYGFFSLTSPIIAKVSESDQDAELVCELLNTLSNHGDDPKYLQFATAEILAKVLAYRNLKVGQVVQIPLKQGVLEDFEVEHVFNLWKGMPAFGLRPLGKNAAPILLFRGTDFSLDSKRGWASLMSDIDLAGPGLKAFKNAQGEIHAWLISMNALGKKPRVLGFSLGGALASYAYIYENEYLASEGSYSFCPPGVSDGVIAAWEALPKERQQGFTTYVNQGDIISKVGKLFGTVYAIDTEKHLKPLTAHTQLMSAEPLISLSPVDTPKENKNR